MLICATGSLSFTQDKHEEYKTLLAVHYIHYLPTSHEYKHKQTQAWAWACKHSVGTVHREMLFLLKLNIHISASYWIKSSQQNKMTTTLILFVEQNKKYTAEKKACLLFHILVFVLITLWLILDFSEWGRDMHLTLKHARLTRLQPDNNINVCHIFIYETPPYHYVRMPVCCCLLQIKCIMPNMNVVSCSIQGINFRRSPQIFKKSLLTHTHTSDHLVT